MYLSTDTVAQLIRATVRFTNALGSNPIGFNLFRCILLCYPDDLLLGTVSTVVCIKK